MFKISLESELDIKSQSSKAFDIPIYILKIAANPLSYALANIFNSSLNQGIFPDKLKIASVTPIHKSKSKISVNNYRPISILPIFSKILERLVHKRTVHFLNQYDIIFEHQFGFQKNKSTNLAILDIYSKIINSFEDKKLSCCVFLDFAKAFDTVDHSILIKKLEHYGIRGIPLNRFRSYLKNRVQYTKIGNIFSDIGNITCGVPQGSVLGPLLFLLFINDINLCSDILEFHLFADDTSIFYSHSDINELELNMNTELRKVAIWLQSNKLTLNVDKSNFILFRPPQKSVRDITLRINNEIITQKSDCKYLGVFFDQHLTWIKHINYVNLKLSKGLGIISKLRHYLSLNLLKMIYFAFFQSHIDYALEIWSSGHSTSLDKIRISNKKAVRLMTFTDNMTHADPIFKDLNILNFDNNVKLTISKLFWKAKNNFVPKCINNILNNKNLTLTNSSRPLRHKPSDKFVPLHRTQYKARFISTRGQVLWNELPLLIKETKSLHTFSKKVRKHLLDI